MPAYYQADPHLQNPKLDPYAPEASARLPCLSHDLQVWQPRRLSGPGTEFSGVLCAEKAELPNTMLHSVIPSTGISETRSCQGELRRTLTYVYINETRRLLKPARFITTSVAQCGC